jgi:hypothetical protein
MNKTITSAEYQKAFGRYGELAQREPVSITSHGRESLVLLSAAEYARLKRLDRRSFFVWELPQETIEAIAKAEPPLEAAAFDHEYQPD